jgi:hypothetical protein
MTAFDKMRVTDYRARRTPAPGAPYYVRQGASEARLWATERLGAAVLVHRPTPPATSLRLVRGGWHVGECGGPG